MPTHSRWSGFREPFLTGTAMVLVLAAMVTVPYLFPAPLSISRSYVAGFSNRAAVLILVLGTACIAVFTRGRIARWQLTDSRLGVGSLALALVLTVAQCLKITRMMTRPPGDEALYFFNRLQLLSAGKVPYTEFEFVYGPLLLYPPVWVRSILHTSLTVSYCVVWLCFWIIGVLLIWMVVRCIDLPMRRRSLLFLLLTCAQVAWAGYGSLSYTPVRAYLAAGCIIATHRVGQRTGSLWLVACTALACIVLTIGVSMDQAIGTIIGVSAVVLLLTVSSPAAPWRWAPLAILLAGTVGCFVWADRAALTAPLRAFGGGGYAYPLLPSFPIIAVLFVYIVGGCVLYRALLARFAQSAGSQREEIDLTLGKSVTIPLAIAGCAMLPNALGRCDLLHITAATPLFLVGIISAFAMPSIARWYVPGSILALIVFPIGFHRILPHLHLPQQPPSYAVLRAQGYAGSPNDNQVYESVSHPVSEALPCDQQYFSPSLMPDALHPFRPACLDTGYYLAYSNVITPESIAFKIQELRSRPAQPLLMEDIPLEAQLPAQLERLENLYFECDSFWVPRARNAPLTYASIIQYIRDHYAQGPVRGDGLRIWYPNVATRAAVTPASRNP